MTNLDENIITEACNKSYDQGRQEGVADYLCHARMQDRRGSCYSIIQDALNKAGINKEWKREAEDKLVEAGQAVGILMQALDDIESLAAYPTAEYPLTDILTVIDRVKGKKST